MRGDILATSAAAMALVIATGVSAPQTNQQQQPQMAEQCMADLRDFVEQSAHSGYGVGGPPGHTEPAPVGGCGTAPTGRGAKWMPC